MQQIDRMKRQTIILILSSILFISFASCNKKVKETTDSKESTVTKQTKKDKAPTQDEIIMADAIKLVKASCNTQRAKMEYQKDQGNSFKKMKFTNLRKHKNEIAQEMKQKYENNPQTKQLFEDAKTKARESLSECKGLTRPGVEEQ